jgi:hypothetical protein
MDSRFPLKLNLHIHIHSFVDTIPFSDNNSTNISNLLLTFFFYTLLQYNTSSEHVQGFMNIIAEDCK